MNEKIKKALEQIKGILNEELTFKEDVKGLIEPVETALNQAEEKEKALNIICTKYVGLSYLYYSENVEDYNNTLPFRFKPSVQESVALTKEEFDLLKKVVKKYGNR